MEKAAFIAKLLAQLVDEYSAEIARIAEREKLTDEQAHNQVQDRIAANDALVLQNNNYFKMIIANRPQT